MSRVLIRKALEVKLAAAAGAVLTIFENTGVVPPADEATPYQRAFFLPAEPDNVVKGARTFREHGIFQVSLMYQAGKGPNAADTRAELLRSWFKRGTTLVQGGVSTQITHTPTISGGFMDGGRWHVPMTIRWQAWVTVA